MHDCTGVCSHHLRYDSRVHLEGQEPPAPRPVVSDSEYLCIDREKEKGNEVLYACYTVHEEPWIRSAAIREGWSVIAAGDPKRLVAYHSDDDDDDEGFFVAVSIPAEGELSDTP